MITRRQLLLATAALLAGGLLLAQGGTDAPPRSRTILDYRAELNLTRQQQRDIRALLDRLQENWRVAWSQAAILDYEINETYDAGSELESLEPKIEEASRLYADARFEAISCSIQVNEGLTTAQLLAWREIQASTEEKSLYGFGFDEPLPQVPPAPPQERGRSIFWGPERELALTNQQVADIKATLFGLQRTLRAIQAQLGWLDREIEIMMQRGGPAELLKANVAQEGIIRTEARCADLACSRKIDSIFSESQLESWRKIRSARSEPPHHFPR